jgi:murein DD-endopeptidase MepM/ murein hydrolase activator NlpD
MYFLTLQKQKNLISFLIIFTLVFGLSSTRALANTNTEKTQTNYELQNSQVQKEIDRISSDIKKISQESEDSGQQSQTLSGQVSKKQEAINQIDKLILDTRLVIGQLDKQIKDNQDKIDRLNKELSELVLEIQNRQLKKPISILFSGKNLGTIIGQIYSISSVEEKIDAKKKEVDEANKSLKKTKEKNEELKTELESTRALFRSEQSGLKYLLDETNGEESRYQSLLKSITEQKSQLEGQLDTLKGDYLAELQDQRSQNYRDTNYTTECPFEEKTPLNIPQGYFGSPATGYLTQPFHCGHDGVDIANDMGSSITSIGDGEVTRVGPEMKGCIGFGCSGGFGNYIVIKHQIPSGQIVYSLYAHLQYKPTLIIGQKVAKGQQVGQMGCTGYTSPYPCGIHLHFMLLSDSLEKNGLGCVYGKAKCYNSEKYIKL